MQKSLPASDLERSKDRISPLAYRAYCCSGRPIWFVLHYKNVAIRSVNYAYIGISFDKEH
jgi:hypothetical protein